jgi:hypothetical protein
MKSEAAVAISAPLLVLALPILDVGLSVVRRFVRRKPVFQADRDHIHHRLLALGFTPRAAAVALYGVAVLFTLLALVMTMTPWHFIWAPLAVALLVIVALIRALGYWEVTEIQKTVTSRLGKRLRASGDAALRGLEAEIERSPRFDDAWAQVCSVSWALGFSRLDLMPRRDYVGLCPLRRSLAPSPDINPASRHGELVPATEATWSIEVAACGTIVADVVGRRPLQITDFDPRRYARIVQGVVAKHVVAQAAEAWSGDTGAVPRPVNGRAASAAPAADAARVADAETPVVA